MTDSESADVLDGGIDAELTEVTTTDPRNLTPHPKNTDIYGDAADAEDIDETFRASIKQKGVLVPLVVTDDNTIISGHRRWTAACDTGLSSVPIHRKEFATELDEREALIEHNRQREKTPGQVVNEFEEMLAIEETRAKERLKSAGSVGGKGTETFQDPSQGEATQNAAEKIDSDVSGRTLRKGKKVKEKAESDDEPEEVQEAAKDAWDDLQSGNESFSGAYQAVKTAQNKAEKRQNREENQEQFKKEVQNETAVDIEHGDFAEQLNGKTEQYDHIITDPPYDKDAIQEWKKLARTAKEVLKPGGLLIAYSGKYHLPSVYDALEAELEYFWQCIVVHSGAGARVWPRNLRTNYKPVIVYAKPPVEELEGLGHDVIDGDGREKDDHEWQQATAESIDLIEQLTEPNDMILDPMCGSGTTGVAALAENRRVHLIDRDEEAVETARERCADVI
jgi:16S rRNA G966 N2-methylase RsmD